MHILGFLGILVFNLIFFLVACRKWRDVLGFPLHSFACFLHKSV
jgi:hypothetical protein